VPCARLHAKGVILEWGLRPIADTAELLVSELVTNAVRASSGLLSPVVRIWLACERNGFFIRVWDGSRQMPVRQDEGLDSECGRGLLLVEALSQDWGAYPKADGKVVWIQV
jgi:two-component sensor histidine kinase